MRLLFWPPSMVYILIIITHKLHITNHTGPSVWAAIHILHSGHFFSWDMGSPYDAILVFLCSVKFATVWYFNMHYFGRHIYPGKLHLPVCFDLSVQIPTESVNYPDFKLLSRRCILVAVSPLNKDTPLSLSISISLTLSLSLSLFSWEGGRERDLSICLKKRAQKTLIKENKTES